MKRRLIGWSAIAGACALVLGLAASTPARADGVSFGDRDFHVRLNWGRPVGDPYCDPYYRDYVVVRNGDYDRWRDRDRHDWNYRDRDYRDWDYRDRDYRDRDYRDWNYRDRDHRDWNYRDRDHGDWDRHDRDHRDWGYRR